ncbi:MAG: polyprenyl synthetase family protein [Cytophagales bacterium]|nr:polyprenyl synthetase family protein [Cytophagales bacterium]
MALTLTQIQAPIQDEMVNFEQKFSSYMKSNVFLLDKIMEYIVKRKGKQLRPMFVFLVAKLQGDVNEKTYRGAALIELLHTATLVHDDVVDDAAYRRNFFSVNALWKNKIAVLVGDYLLSRGLLLSVDNEDFELLKIVSTAVRQMSEGELLQIEKARLLNIKEEDYYLIIKQKTASLIASCCAVGMASVSNNNELIHKAHLLGENIGMAFQIKDDLFDYGTADIGKPVGIDIKEKKMTIPLIYALNHTTWIEKQSIINIIKNDSKNPKKVKYVIDFVKKSGGLEYATQSMNRYHQKALEILHTLPHNTFSDALASLISFTIERES